MPWRLATVVAMVVFLAAALARAKPSRRLKFHPLTPRFEERLQPRTRDNVNAVVRYAPEGQATGVLVARLPGPARTGLVLTNFHAVEANPTTSVVFADGKRGAIRRVVNARERLDYALIEVDLPEGSTAEPVRLRGADIEAGERVYAVSASANPLALPMKFWRTTARASRQEVRQAAAAGAMRTLQTGLEIGGGRTHLVPVSGLSKRVLTWSYAFRLPNAPGMSGSPVFSSKTHELVALHWGGNLEPRAWQATGVPIRRILHDLAVALHRGRIAGDLHDPLTKLLLDAAARH